MKESGHSMSEIAKLLGISKLEVEMAIDHDHYMKTKIINFEGKWDAAVKPIKDMYRRREEDKGEAKKYVVFNRTCSRAGFWWMPGHSFSRASGGIEG